MNLDSARVRATEQQKAKVLIVDDEDLVRKALSRVLRHYGHDVLEAESVPSALEAVDHGVDIVLCDLNMPGANGLDLLTSLRHLDFDLPVILLTGSPSLETAASAVKLGAFRYLIKPATNEDLIDAIADAMRARSLLRARDVLTHRGTLERSFRSALDALHLAFQPIVAVDSRAIAGYEVLMRSNEPTLPNPLAVLDAAEKLGTLHLLGRHIRGLIVRAIESTPTGTTFFVNIHPADLADPALLDESSDLARHAHRIVFELTERASLETVPDSRERIARLRKQRYRIAIDDLGAGYAGLTYFADVDPDLVKIDMSLVRGIHRDSVRQQVVLSLTSLARSLGIDVVAEGVETREERDALVSLGCNHLQGYLLARPGPPFPAVTWAE
jgi:EAL domain-containing protein (putative c-di-GMP-specific phosphodiesterase class I)